MLSVQRPVSVYSAGVESEEENVFFVCTFKVMSFPVTASKVDLILS